MRAHSHAATADSSVHAEVFKLQLEALTRCRAMPRHLPHDACIKGSVPASTHERARKSAWTPRLLMVQGMPIVHVTLSTALSNQYMRTTHMSTRTRTRTLTHTHTRTRTRTRTRT